MKNEFCGTFNGYQNYLQSGVVTSVPRSRSLSWCVPVIKHTSVSIHYVLGGRMRSDCIFILLCPSISTCSCVCVWFVHSYTAFSYSIQNVAIGTVLC